MCPTRLLSWRLSRGRLTTKYSAARDFLSSPRTTAISGWVAWWPTTSCLLLGGTRTSTRVWRVQFPLKQGTPVSKDGINWITLHSRATVSTRVSRPSVSGESRSGDQVPLHDHPRHCRRSLARRRRRPFHHRHSIAPRRPHFFVTLSPHALQRLCGHCRPARCSCNPANELCLGSKPTGAQDSQFPTALATQDGQPGNGGGREAGASELVQGIIVSRPLSGMRISGPLAPPPGLEPLMPPPPRGSPCTRRGARRQPSGSSHRPRVRSSRVCS